MDMTVSDRPWVSSYDAGVPVDIDLEAVKPLSVLIAQSLDDYADRPAITVMGLTKTYAEVAALSAQYGGYITGEAGLKKGDRIAIMLPNLLPFPVAMFAHIMAGLVQVNVNPMYTPRELKHQLNDAGASTIVIFEASLPTLMSVIAETPVKQVIVVAPGSLMGAAPAQTPTADGVTFITIEDALDKGKAHDFALDESVTKDDLVFLQYTGGTTGLSKGAMLSQGNVSANIAQSLQFFGDFVSNDGEVVITALPLYHIFALTVNMLSQVTLGSHNILVPNPTDMPGFVDVLKKTTFTFFTGVNTLYNGLLHTPGFEKVDFSKLKFAMGGGAPVQKAVSDKWQAMTGRHIVEGYGLSETSPVVTTNPLSQTAFKEGVGVPLPSTIVSIRDEAGEPVAKGEPGELCVYGPQVMSGYWNLPDKTAEVFTKDGFFRTGDIAVEDDGGFFRIVDRLKDMILVSGFNVFPNEIEECVAAMPGVVECACIGVPDDKTGEAVRLFVVKGDGADISEESVRSHCRDVMTAYKVPKRVIFLDELPKSTVGKILRRELRNPDYNQD